MPQHASRRLEHPRLLEGGAHEHLVQRGAAGLGLVLLAYLHEDRDAALHPLTKVLTQPELILDEWKRRQAQVADPEQVALLRARLKSLEKREERLVRLFGFGEVDEAAIRPALAEVRRERDATTGELAALEPRPQGEVLDETALRATCAAIAERLEHARGSSGAGTGSAAD